MPHYFLCRTFPQRSEFEVQKVLKLLPQRSENITLCPVGCCIWDGGCCFWDGKQPSPKDPESFWISGQEDFSVVTGPEGTAGSCVRGGHQGWTLGQGAFLQRMSQALSRLPRSQAGIVGVSRAAAGPRHFPMLQSHGLAPAGLFQHPQLSGLCQPLRTPLLCCSHERMPYQRRCRRDSDACRLEERSPSFGEECYPARPRAWRRSRGREQHRPRRYQHHCRRRRSRSCSSASSVSSIHSQLGL